MQTESCTTNGKLTYAVGCQPIPAAIQFIDKLQAAVIESGVAFQEMDEL